MPQPRSGQAVLDRPTGHRQALVVLNPSADRCSPGEVNRLLAETLETAGWRCQFAQVESIAQLDAVARQALTDGYDMMVVAGGDGTVARVARHLVGTNVPLGIIPLGQANTLSQGLGVPQDPGAAASILAGEHRLAPLDSLQTGEHHFFLQVGTAAASTAGDEAAGESGNQPGSPANPAETIRRAFGFGSRRFTLQVDGRRYRAGAWQVIVVNTGAFGSELLRSGPQIHPADGAAEIVVLHVRGPLDLLRAGLRFAAASQTPEISVGYHRVREVAAIIPDEPMPVQGDGEAIGTTPLQVRVVPGSVNVIVPPISSTAAPEVPPRPAARRRSRWRQGWFRAALQHRLSPVGALDTALFLAISRLPHPPALDAVVQAVEDGMANGNGWVAGVVAARPWDWRRLSEDLLGLIPALWLTTSTIEFPIKAVFARPRPFETLVLTSIVGPKPASHSFPSGHSASSFAAAWLIGQRHPRWRPALYALAALVAFSRVYKGVHYPSDVVIGASAGAGLAALYDQVFRLALRGASRLIR